MTRPLCDCADVLKAKAAEELAARDRAARSPKLRPQADLLHRRFLALGWASGVLRLHHSGLSPPPDDDPGPTPDTPQGAPTR